MRIALLLATALAIAGCGGGGGDAPAQPPSNRAPVADAGADRNENEQLTVTLDGTGSSDPDGDGLTYSWSQTNGVAVTLASANTSRATFESPNVGIGSSVSLSFRLQVSDGSQINSDNVTITVDGVTNSDPVVDAGSDRSAPELTVVGLVGTASDDDIGDTLGYTWSQLSGPAVTIANATSATADFDAPDVGATGEVLVFQLAVDDGTTVVTDDVEISVVEPPPTVTISGKVQYEFVPPAPLCFGLDFANTETRPIRAATVQLIEDGSGNVLASTVANDQGDYSFTGVSPNTPVRLRVRAELKNTGALPNWDVEVRDNVDISANPPPLAQRPLYVVEGGVFDTGVIDQTRNLTATTGWDGTSYSGARAAAPFAVLDTIYQGMLTLLAVDPNLDFVPLDAFWSVNNVLTLGSTFDIDDIDNGELPASLYIGAFDSLFLVGDANTDTEEFDSAIVAHEWGHYLDDNFSRSDSIGGPHRLGRSLDPRLAFGEGLAYALAGIIVDDPLGCDTGPAGSGSGGSWNVETFNSGLQGWFNEMSVATFVYDIWDTDDDGTDNGSIGFDPIWNTLVGPMRDTDAFTTLFSFAAELRPMLNAADLALVDALLNAENVDTPNVDIWGDGQTTAPGSGTGMLPVYTQVPTDGSVVNVCAYDEFTFAQEGNKLAERRYLRFTTTSPASWTITAQANPVPPPTSDPPPGANDPPIRDRGDPDLFLYRKGVYQADSRSPDDDVEVFATPVLPAGTYTVDLQEWRYADENKSSDFPGEVCYDVSISP